MDSAATGQTDSPTAPGLPTPYRIRHLDPDREDDAVLAARLHVSLFREIGPIAQLGERLLREYCYAFLLRKKLMKAVVIEVGGEPAGLAAYTGDPLGLHRAALRSHLPFLIGATLRAVVAKPSLLLRLPAAVRLIWSRVGEKLPVSDARFAEIVAFGVLPQFLSSQFIRRTGLHVSDLLLNRVLDELWSSGYRRVRGIILASNKPVVAFSSVRASRVEEFPTAVRPSLQVWLDMDGGRDDRLPTLKASRRRRHWPRA
jgi:hypothetical protein